MLTPIQQIQNTFHNIQQLWTQSFSDHVWHTETFQPKPHYFNRIMTIENDGIFEKAGIACSTIAGTQLPPAASTRHPELAGKPFEVTGISLVFHPQNPFSPSVHANLRYFQSENTWWFGGGMDLTPYYPHTNDCQHWHQTLKNACDGLATKYYPDFKHQCDEYFYLKHRQEMRGIGGIFFDDLNEQPFDQMHAWIQTLGEAFVHGYAPILAEGNQQTYSDHQRAFQQHRRTRYAEFNLLYDRGTLFGLQYGGRIESILMSMPPSTGWIYAPSALIQADDQALAPFLQPKDWVASIKTS